MRLPVLLLALTTFSSATAPVKPARGPYGALPDVTLTALDGSQVRLPACAQAKCLTVVVAPWCPRCREAAASIAALRGDLAARGVDVRVVVSFDAPGALRHYGSAFGPDTLLDPDVKLWVNGVPHFLVSTDGGAIVGDKAGALDAQGSEPYAAWLELP